MKATTCVELSTVDAIGIRNTLVIFTQAAFRLEYGTAGGDLFIAAACQGEIIKLRSCARRILAFAVSTSQTTL
jgi:hypothetical protein